MNLGATLENFLKKNGYPNLEITVTHDSIASLLSAKAIEITHNYTFTSAINVIVGEGSNVAIKCDQENGESFLVNTEFGNFEGATPSRYDYLIEKEYNIGSDYHNEKMISGRWQHLLMKTILKDLIKNNQLPEKILGNIDIENMDSAELEKITNASVLDTNCQEILEFIWKEILRRGSTLIGLMLSTTIKAMQDFSKQKNMEIAIIENGGVLERAAGFRGNMIKTMNNELIDADIADKIKLHFFSPKYECVPGAVIFNTFHK
ncbi:hypothetical protein GF376_02705 [Candidatus Peregrinibacteria bacterium]|nr:hypothetical protein [Candidatus Peregrinibacteria bacterium]